MDRQDAIKAMNRNIMIADTQFSSEALIMSRDALEKLEQIEQLINDPLVKARGAVGTEKIREILEAGYGCQKG